MTWASFVKRTLRNFAYSVPVTVAFLDHVGYIAKVEGISMQPALNPGNQKFHDYVFLNKWSTRNFEVEHGDVVALICPRDPDQKIIKRIIAKPGDTIKAAKHHRYINIPVGHCWVEGDHLDHSMDSNFFGPVSLGLVTAKASYIVWPPSRWQKLESVVPEARRPIFYFDPDGEAPWFEDDYAQKNKRSFGM